MRRIFIASLMGLLMLAVAGEPWSGTLILRNGTRISGILVSATARTITFKDGRGVSRRYATNQIEALEFTNASRGATGASNNNSYRVVVPSGTEFVIRTNEEIDSKIASTNQTFSAQMKQDVRDSSNNVVVPKGSDAVLVIRSANSGGAVGSADIFQDIESIMISGRRYQISTADLQEKNNSGLGANKLTAVMVGGAAAIGTVIGAIVGHGKGAAIGAAVGAAGGAGAQVLTRGKEVRVPAETVLKFRLDQSVNLRATNWVSGTEGR